MLEKIFGDKYSIEAVIGVVGNNGLGYQIIAERGKDPELKKRAEMRLVRIAYGGSIDDLLTKGEEVLVRISEYKGRILNPKGRIVTNVNITNGTAHKSFGE